MHIPPDVLLPANAADMIQRLGSEHWARTASLIAAIRADAPQSVLVAALEQLHATVANDLSILDMLLYREQERRIA